MSVKFHPLTLSHIWHSELHVPAPHVWRGNKWPKHGDLMPHNYIFDPREEHLFTHCDNSFSFEGIERRIEVQLLLSTILSFVNWERERWIFFCGTCKIICRQVLLSGNADKYCLNPLSPKSDKHLISPYNVTSWSNIQVVRIKEMITRHKVCWCLIEFSQLVT